MMTQGPGPSITLADEEASFVAAMFRPQEELLTAGLSDEDILGIAYGERSLRARELADLDADGNVKINTGLMAIIHVSTLPEQAIVLTRTKHDGDTAVIEGLVLGDGVVLRTYPERGLQKYEVLGGIDELITGVTSLIALCGDRETDSTSFQLESTSLRLLRDSAANGDLTANLIPSDTLEAYTGEFRAFLLSPYDLITLTFVQRPDGPSDMNETLTIVQSIEEAWLIEPVAGDSDLLRVARAGSDDVRRTLERWFQE